MSEALVLGAGMVGITTAIELQSHGVQTFVVDRKAPGRETSYGNAGIIQAEAAEPYPLPRDLAILRRIILGQSNDVTWSFSAVLQSAPALLGYFRNSAPKRHEIISRAHSNLISSVLADHAPLISDSGADNLISRDGFCCVYRDGKSLAAAVQEMERLKATYGIAAHALSGEDFVSSEPSFLKRPAGAVHWADCWTCSDPGGLTQKYADLFVARGGEILIGDATTLRHDGAGWQVMSTDGPVSSSSVIVALGPWAPGLLKTLGYRIPMIFKRGYHGHYAAPKLLHRPFLDVSNGVVAASMSKGLRVTSGVSIVPQDKPPYPRQLERGAKALSDLIDLGDRIEEPQWYGTRPFMPDMLPVVGKASKHDGLWFNFGHGHHGFTLGPTTARILVDAMLGTNEFRTLQSPLDPSRWDA